MTNKLRVTLPDLGIEGVNELIEFYKKYDTTIQDIRKETGVYCLNGCGACCCTPSNHLEASVFELIPMAIYLSLRGEAESVLKELDESDDIESIPCVIYHKDSIDGKLGHCSLYDYRPLICRIFGGSTWYSAKKNRNEALLCKLLKDSHALTPELLQIIEQKFPLCTDVAVEARSFNLTFDQTLLSINVALKKALEYVLFVMQWFNPDDTPTPNTPPILTPSGNAA